MPDREGLLNAQSISQEVSMGRPGRRHDSASFAIEKSEAETTTSFAQYNTVTSEVKNGTDLAWFLSLYHWPKLKSFFYHVWTLPVSRTITT